MRRVTAVASWLPGAPVQHAAHIRREEDRPPWRSATPNTSSTRFIARYHRLPVQARLVLTGILGALLGWITYELLYSLNPFARYRATSSWAASWVLSVWRQHALHRWLTFASRAPYARSLGRVYVFYAASGILGGWANFQLVSGLGVHHRTAWLVCLAGGGLISLLFLRTFVHREA